MMLVRLAIVNQKQQHFLEMLLFFYGLICFRSSCISLSEIESLLPLL